jgi:hypothetical protein
MSRMDAIYLFSGMLRITNFRLDGTADAHDSGCDIYGNLKRQASVQTEAEIQFEERMSGKIYKTGDPACLHHLIEANAVGETG